jgi:hypothetical protein
MKQTTTDRKHRRHKLRGQQSLLSYATRMIRENHLTPRIRAHYQQMRDDAAKTIASLL